MVIEEVRGVAYIPNFETPVNLLLTPMAASTIRIISRNSDKGVFLLIFLDIRMLGTAVGRNGVYVNGI